MNRARNGAYRLLAIVLIILIAGPEIGVAIDLIVTLDILGAELFLTSFIVGIRMLPWSLALHSADRLIRRIDPYFFVPSKRQLRLCPALAAHAVPLLVPVSLALAVWGSVQAEI